MFLAIVLGVLAAVQEKWQLWVVYAWLMGTALGSLNLNVFSAAVIRLMPPSKHSLATGIAGNAFPSLSCFDPHQGMSRAVADLDSCVADRLRERPRLAPPIGLLRAAGERGAGPSLQRGSYHPLCQPSAGG